MKKIVTLVLLAVAVMASAEDVIVTKEATKISAKIEEVGQTEIKYKKVSYLDGPAFTMPTSEILCIIFDNGEVMIFDKPKKQEVNGEKRNSLSEISLTREEVERFDGIPRKLVALSGDYSMLYDKKALVYFDVNFDDTHIVKFTHFDAGVETWAFSTAGYYNGPDFQSINLSETYKTFNENPIFPKKCCLVPINDATVNKSKYNAYYKMELRVRFLDIGNSTVSSMTNTSGEAGGAVIYGELVITDLTTDKEICRILVDRIKGKNSPYPNVRLERAISEMLMPELFHVKKK